LPVLVIGVGTNKLCKDLSLSGASTTAGGITVLSFWQELSFSAQNAGSVATNLCEESTLLDMPNASEITFTDSFWIELSLTVPNIGSIPDNICLCLLLDVSKTLDDTPNDKSFTVPSKGAVSNTLCAES
jgi:hypothetical protein